jgi:chromosome partitioning protein
MAIVVTVMNMKGGVGKTTVAMHIAGALARYRWPSKNPIRVLMIDYDPQFNLSQAFLPAKDYFALEKAKKTVLSVLQEDVATWIRLNFRFQVHRSPRNLLIWQ